MRRFLALFLLVPLLAATAPTNPGTLTTRHFELDRSLPAADAEVSSPTAVMLWFTQVPQDDATTIRVIDANGELVAAESLVQYPDDRTAFLLPIPTGLKPGSYTVSWRSMAADGHVVRGEFGFDVLAP